jgi:hypothetical protein
MSHDDILLNKGTMLGSAHMDFTTIVDIVEVKDPSPGPEFSAPQLFPGDTLPPEDWISAMHLENITSETRKQVIDTIIPFARMWYEDLGEINTTPHRIEISPGAQAVFQPPYRAEKAGRRGVKREIERMLKAGVIQPASEWASPVVSFY